MLCRNYIIEGAEHMNNGHANISEEGQLAEKIFKSISVPEERRLLFCEDIPPLIAAVRKRYPALMVSLWNERDRDNLYNNNVRMNGEHYDYIYVGRLLEQTSTPDKLVVNIRKLLRKNGQAWYLVGNIHHGEVLQQIVAEHWPGDSEIVREIFAPYVDYHYTRQDVAAILARNGYEHVWVDLLAKDISVEQQERFRGCGIEFADEEFNAVYWFIKAGRFDEAGVELRSHYTEPVRQNLVKYLRRIENGIDTRANIKRLWQLCEKEGITFEYLQAFMQHSLLDYAHTMQILAASLQEG